MIIIIRWLWEKENCKYLGILKADTIKQRWKKRRKKKKRVPQKKKNSRNQTQQQKSHPRNKHLGSQTSNKLRNIFKRNRRRTKINGLKTKEIDDYSLGLISKGWHRQTTIAKKIIRKSTHQNRGLDSYINSRTWEMHWKVQRKTNYRHH